MTTAVTRLSPLFIAFAERSRLLLLPGTTLLSHVFQFQL